MNNRTSLQCQMDSAFDNYFSLSEVLREDLNVLLDSELDSATSRRNFIRASAAMIEGYAHCIREMCLIGLQCDTPDITNKEAAAIRSERDFNTTDRFKLTVRAAFKIFELSPLPDFGGARWARAQEVLKKRHMLMHPKEPGDLQIESSSWIGVSDDVAWLMQQLFAFFELLQEKHTH